MRRSGSDKRSTVAAAAALTCAVGGGACAQVLPDADADPARMRLPETQYMGALDERSGAFRGASGLGFGRGLHSPASVWLRSADGGFRPVSPGASGGPTAQLQAGADMASWSLLGSGDRVRLGAMAGAGRAPTDLLTPGNPLQLDGRASGTNVGAYATWFQHDRSRLGWYADSWGQYNWYRSEANAQLPADAAYRGNDALLSFETGYTLQLAEGLDWRMTPQGQAVYVRKSGAGLAGPGADDSGWISRLGVRFTTPAAEAGAWRLQPYATVNWWHDGLGSTATLIDPGQARAFYPSERYEVKTGLEVLFGPKWSAWGSLGMQWGDQSYKNWSAGIGLRYAM